MKIERMARRFFSPPEQEAVFRLDEGRRPLRFFELWTAKEAFVKALGTGFAHGFREFTICIDPLSAGDGWHLERLDFGDDYAATVAIRGDRRRIVMEDGRALFSR
ncbi:MAG TPA: 4'-phosphopantetheinyl transferase superfamily protein [Thermoanaerobaculia bacterium]|nr:4'-phosphopantetheinyl transferase superfamily protein [Thermoanaerobaculia bacterium]